MATVPKQRRTRQVDYPTTDGRPMAETELHIYELIDTLTVLRDWFAPEPKVYVGGNMLLFYEEGNRRKHISPDVFVSKDVPKEPMRDYYLVWKEGKGPDFVAEITSKTTKREDEKKKLILYRDVLRVPEYFLFDPRAEYLDPPLQGFRLEAGEYVPIAAVDGRLPSAVLGLHLERDGQNLRLYDPATAQRLPTRLEAREAAMQRALDERQRAEAATQRALDERQRAEAATQRALDERQRAEAAAQRALDERQRAEAATQSALDERQRAEAATQRALDERQRAANAESALQLLADENERLRREIESLRGQ